MHTIYSRVNNVSAFLSSCLMGLVLAVAVSSALYQMYQTPPAGELAVTNMKVWVVSQNAMSSFSLPYLRRRLPGKGRYSRKHGTRQQEFAFVNLNLTAGASSVIPPRHHHPTREIPFPLSAHPLPPSSCLAPRQGHAPLSRGSPPPTSGTHIPNIVRPILFSPSRATSHATPGCVEPPRSATVSKGPLHIHSLSLPLRRKVEHRTASHRRLSPGHQALTFSFRDREDEF